MSEYNVFPDSVLCSWTLESQKIKKPVVTLQQCHGVRIVEGRIQGSEKADGVWTKQKKCSLVIKTADCVPLFFYDQAAGIIAAVHAGWKGTAQNISGIMIDTLVTAGANISTLSCTIGHCIHSCHYQVQEDVAERFKQYEGSVVVRGKNLFLDLIKVNKEQLLTKGMKASRIHILSECTYCNAAFPSYRRDGNICGVLYHFIRLV